jgi:branched-chain amino acid transport system ATP-binding protein
MTNELTVRGLKKSFGGLTALKGVDITVPARSVLGVIGMNGSGKTTMLNCIGGLYRADAGSIRFAGTELIGLAPERVARLGVGRTFQVPRVFPRLTLLDNLEVSQIPFHRTADEAARLTEQWLREVELFDLRHNYGEELSGGQQKLLELARIMVARPGLILLGEPFAGVNPRLAKLLIDIIRRIPSEHGCSVILVSHDLSSIYQLSDHIVVMNEGTVLSEGNADRVRNDPAVVEAYLGA